jgi:hypothetical protein
MFKYQASRHYSNQLHAIACGVTPWEAEPGSYLDVETASPHKLAERLQFLYDTHYLTEEQRCIKDNNEFEGLDDECDDTY